MVSRAVIAALTALMMVVTTVLAAPASLAPTTSRISRASRTCPSFIGAQTHYNNMFFDMKNNTLNIPANFAKASVHAWMQHLGGIEVFLVLHEPETGVPQGDIFDLDSDYFGPNALNLTGESRVRIGSGKPVRRKFDILPVVPLFLYRPSAYTKISDIPFDGDAANCCDQPVTVSFKLRMCKDGVCVKRSGKFKKGRLPCTKCPGSKKPVSNARTQGYTRCE